MALRIFLTAMSLLLSRVLAQSTTESPYNPAYMDCCELKLMDSNLQVVIESNRILPSGTFTSLKARVCSTDTIFIQIWRKISETSYEFRWQTQMRPTQADTTKAYALVRFETNPVTITADDRLGVYNPSNTSLKISIPYQFDRPLSAMYLSGRRFESSSVFVQGYVVTFDDLRWPRTFNPYVTFCRSLSECPDLSPDPAATTTYNPYSGNAYIPASCCSTMVPCDTGGAVKDSLTNQSKQVQILQDTINNLQKTLEDLLNSQYVTGTCPTNFTAGVYGLGSCYIAGRQELQMGQAVIKCRDQYTARLLNIQSEQEDKFIKNFLLNTSSSGAVERFWTSGMYNIQLRNWFWYDDDLLTKMPFGVYRNWKDGLEPAATGIYDVCSVFTIDEPKNIDYWEKAICTNLNYYICEVPKICL